MQYRKSIISASLISSSLASYVPSEPWSTLTPASPAPTGAHTDYSKTFGIAVVPITTGSLAPTATPSAPQKRDVVSQINDGQIQATTATPAQVVSQIGDGQIQATTATSPKAEVVSQIGDGQIQATTATAQPTCENKTVTVTVTAAPKAEVVSQIGDGQIQATATTKNDVVSQIGDGQIQATKADVVSQIGDGQIQATTAPKAEVVSQIGDGQIQATTTANVASQINDGQIQATESASPSAPSGPSSFEHLPQGCLTEKSLAMTLKDGVLTDSAGRIGAIVSNRQFQFDGPPPQAGSIYAAGWSITKEGNLAIGSNDVFYQCLSGSFYNLYDETLGEHCHAIHLGIVDLIGC